MSDKSNEIKKEAGKKRKTIGDAIDYDIDWIIATSKTIFENETDHPLWRKTEAEVAELFLIDHQMKEFKAEQTIKKVREHYKVD